MNYKKLLFFILNLGPISFTCPEANNIDCISYTISPATTILQLYWKNDKGQQLKSLQALKDHCTARGEKLLFAMNGGMYKEDGSPLGLYIENGKTLIPINQRTGSGNFYLQPNGVFYINKNKTANICTTAKFINSSNIQYATQSGPMLLINDTINTVFKNGSTNLNIRNGVGILPNNQVIFAMSKEPVSLYDFAAFFKQAGCSNALYLDGFVSRTYLPEKNWIQTHGNFGELIGASVKEKK